MGDAVHTPYVRRASQNLVEQLEERQHPRVAGFRGGVQLELLQHVQKAESPSAAVHVPAA